MKILIPCLLLAAIFFSLPSFATTVPVSDPGPAAAKKLPAWNLKPADIEKMTGRKLGWLQKLQLKVLLAKLKKGRVDGVATPKQKKMGKLSMFLGIGSVIFLFLPVLVLFSIPMAIAALILGCISLKGNSNTEGIVGVITSSITLVILILAIIIVLSVLRFE